MESEKTQQPLSRTRKKIFRFFLLLTGLTLLSGLITAVGLYTYLAPQLPAIESLRDVKFQVPLKVYSNEGVLIAQFGEKKRTPVTVDEIPQKLSQAFISAEDDRFYEHPGVDYQGLLRAAIQLALTGKKKQGGSTITMQVARNFFLTKEKTFTRKFKEILLALKIERELSKDQILELYLNKIYLGHRSYGIAAASQTYYGKKLDELNLSQLAMIAGLPKAPSRYNPVSNPERALARRNYVLDRMQTLGYISEDEYSEALNQPVTANLQRRVVELEAPYIAEMVRAHMTGLYGDDAYTEGLEVTTTLLAKNQTSATQALRKALYDYDLRHGYKGPIGKIENVSPETPIETLDQELEKVPSLSGALPAVIISVDESFIEVYSKGNSLDKIEWSGLEWGRKYLDHNRRGAKPKQPSDFLDIGDIIYYRNDESGKPLLTQPPEIAGAFIGLNPANGAIEALVGGFDYYKSKFNRATQSKRQPGSGFKPVLYTTALENGYTPATLINDAPVVFDDPKLESEWRPENYSGKFFGPTRLRVALRNSRNLVSIRILRDLGINKVISSSERFGFDKNQLPRDLSLALGSGYATPLEMATAYAVFANGGHAITPFFIETIRDREGNIIFQASPDTVLASSEEAPPPEASNLIETSSEQEPPPNLAPRVVSPEIHFLMNSMLQDVVKRGTARRALSLQRSDLAGKTGTTNDQRDAWFNGYATGHVAVAWVGFDSNNPLGSGETGGRAALPMWIDYMKKILEGAEEKQFEQPESITSIQIDPESGLLAQPNDPEAIFEYFSEENVPAYSASERTPAANPYSKSEGEPLF